MLSICAEVTAKFSDSAWAANSVMCTRCDLTICWKAKAPQMGPFTLPASLGAACTMLPFFQNELYFHWCQNNNNIVNKNHASKEEAKGVSTNFVTRFL